MNLDHSGRKLLVTVFEVIVSLNATIRNAVRAIQPRAQIEIRTTLAAKRIGLVLALLAALGAGDLLAKRGDAGRL